VLRGEGIGPEVVATALEVLGAVTSHSGIATEISEGGCIGRKAEQRFGTALPQDVIAFCESIFARGGVILHGPGGGRFVYDLRKALNLFLKISPLHHACGLLSASCLRPDLARHVDIVMMRENLGGIYQGEWEPLVGTPGERVARHIFGYTESCVMQFLEASARLAKQRSGRLAVVWKESGIPSVSGLWRECAERVGRACQVDVRLVDVDLMAYQLVSRPQSFDVIAAANLFGDVIADLGAAMLGSRGLSFGGNYSPGGDAVYQTNHGAAYDLAGTDRANPVAQIFSVAMMLRETFGLSREAAAVEEAVRSVWRDGWRTDDLAAPSARTIGTHQMGSLIAERAVEILESWGSRADAEMSHASAAHPG
jgi:3-isopropylmalate dehydrogenase